LNILFICSRNKWRSRTAETIFKNNGQHQVRSAGTENTARIRLNQKTVDWADLIFAMERKHKRRLVENFETNPARQEIVILEIPDDYKYMDAELIRLLREGVDPYF